jgi:site-specific DNA-methyltransferase (adenine-specific)
MPQAKTDDWATPQYLFDKYNSYHHFDLDPAASSTNHKTEKWFGLDHPDESRRDGLLGEWDGERVWLNPPYGRVISKWVKKAANHVYTGKGEVLLLLPARTDTIWFHDYCIMHAVEFLRGRVKFGDSKQGAPFPSMIVRMK